MFLEAWERHLSSSGIDSETVAVLAAVRKERFFVIALLALTAFAVLLPAGAINFRTWIIVMNESSTS
jgi:hypothetical protein